MKKQLTRLTRRLLAASLAMVMAAGLMSTAFAQYGGGSSGDDSVTWKEVGNNSVTASLGRREAAEPKNISPYADDEQVRISIVLKDEPTIAMFALENIAEDEDAVAYREMLEEYQEAVAEYISEEVLGEELDVVSNLTLVANIISANVEYGQIEAIKDLEVVEDVFVEPAFSVQDSPAADPQMIIATGAAGTPGMTDTVYAWEKGYRGQGMRIAIIDSGLDLEHQSFDSDAFRHALEEDAEVDEGIESVDDYNLLSAAKIEGVFEQLNVSKRDKKPFSADSFYYNAKVPFAYNYIDRNYTVDHSVGDGSHGTQVAGAAAANRYIPDGEGGYDDALETVYTVGQAPDAQLVVMKVFGAGGGAYMSDYALAVEDAIVLGCAAANISIGSVAGFTTTSYSGYKEYQKIFDDLADCGMVVSVSVGNYGYWAEDTYIYDLYSEDVNFLSGGDPGTYANSFTVANANVNGEVGIEYPSANGVSFDYRDATSGKNKSFGSLGTDSENGAEYDYVFFEGFGALDDYDGIDVAGKVVFVSRGGGDELDSGGHRIGNFSTKAYNAITANHAAAVIVYNNKADGAISIGLSYDDVYTGTSPVASISKANADKIKAASTSMDGYSGVYTGKITIYNTVKVNTDPDAVLSINETSSWGVPGDLSLKPEITAPASNIWMPNGTSNEGGGPDQYVSSYGTSFAAPQIAGISALVKQYINAKGLSQDGLKDRALIQSLLMSTAVPMKDANGNYYSVMQQGSGMVNTAAAVSADSYILMDADATKSWKDGKVKVELGDDPGKSGSYTFTFSINNLDGKEHSYALGGDLFTQATGVDTLFEYYTTLSTSTEPLEGASVGFSVNGVGLERVTVPAGDSVTVTATITLDGSEMDDVLDERDSKGAYVEAYITVNGEADPEGTAGTRHSIPVLGFYGNWTDPSMFDKNSYSDYVYDTWYEYPYLYENNGIEDGYYDDGEWISAEYSNYLTVNYANGVTGYMGANPFSELVETDYLEARNALNNENGDMLGSWYYTLIRNTAARRLLITDVETKATYKAVKWSNLTSAAYYDYDDSGYYWSDAYTSTKMEWAGTDRDGNKLAEGTTVEVTVFAAPELYPDAGGNVDWTALGDGAKLTTRVTIDNTAPELIRAKSSFDPETGDFTIAVQDNQFVSAVALITGDGETVLDSATPDQTVKGEDVTVTLNIGKSRGEIFLVQVYDYACNTRTYEVKTSTPETEVRYSGYNFTDNEWGYYSEDGTWTKTADGLGTSVSVKYTAGTYYDGKVYAITGGGIFYNMDADNPGEPTQVADLSNVYLDEDYTHSLYRAIDMAYDSADDTIYVCCVCYDWDEDEEYIGDSMGIFSIDPSTGDVTGFYETENDYYTLAFDDEGTLYALAYAEEYDEEYDDYYGQAYLYTLALDDSGAVTETEVETGDYDGWIEDLSWGAWYPVYGSTYYYPSMTWDSETEQLVLAAYVYSDSYKHTLFTIDPSDCTAADLGITKRLSVLCVQHEKVETVPSTDEVESVSLPSSLTMLIGSTQKLTATLLPENLSDQSVTWTSSDPSVVKVAPSGAITEDGWERPVATLTAVSTGTAEITAASTVDGTKYATCTVTVISPKIALHGLVTDNDGTKWAAFNTEELPELTMVAAYDIPLANTAVTPDGTIYGIDLDYDWNCTLYTIDPGTKAATEVGGITNSWDGGEYYLYDLAYAPSSGVLLAVAEDSYLYAIDPETGAMKSYSGWGTYNTTLLVSIMYVESEDGYDRFLLMDEYGNLYSDWIQYDNGWSYWGIDDSYLGSVGYESDGYQYNSMIVAADDKGINYLLWSPSGSNQLIASALDLEKWELGSPFVIGSFPSGADVSGLMAPIGTPVDPPDDPTPAPLPVVPPTPTDSSSVTTGVVKDGETSVTETTAVIDSKTAGGTAAAAVSTEVAQAIIDQAVSNESSTVVIAPDMGSDVTKAEVTLPASLVSELEKKTDAELRVETPAATVTIPNESLSSLVEAGSAVTVSAERVGNTVEVLIEASGEQVDELCGGITVKVPQEDCTPGTVAMLVYEDGATQVVRKSVAGDDGNSMIVPLDGSAKIVIADNSASFSDVSTTNWFSDAIAFASSHELMKGTAEGIFAPDVSMTRGMAAMVLHNLEYNPELGVSAGFKDVRDGAWYTEAVAWAEAEGIVKGYPDGSFRPNDPITREQMAVMLYSYAGSPEVSVTELSFVDADKVSGYAWKAIAWASSNGIINGKGNGVLDPKGTATRAEMAQVLWNFMSRKA